MDESLRTVPPVKPAKSISGILKEKIKLVLNARILIGELETVSHDKLFYTRNWYSEHFDGVNDRFLDWTFQCAGGKLRNILEYGNNLNFVDGGQKGGVIEEGKMSMGDKVRTAVGFVIELMGALTKAASAPIMHDSP